MSDSNKGASAPTPAFTLTVLASDEDLEYSVVHHRPPEMEVLAYGASFLVALLCKHLGSQKTKEFLAEQLLEIAEDTIDVEVRYDN